MADPGLNLFIQRSKMIKLNTGLVCLVLCAEIAEYEELQGGKSDNGF